MLHMLFSVPVATLYVSGRNSIMSTMGLRWLDPGVYSLKASQHLEEEKEIWIRKAL